jgi:hypothetical protein
MDKIEYRYRFWYRYRPKFMVSDWYRIETKKAGIAHHYLINDNFFLVLNFNSHEKHSIGSEYVTAHSIQITTSIRGLSSQYD